MEFEPPYQPLPAFEVPRNGTLSRREVAAARDSFILETRRPPEPLPVKTIPVECEPGGNPSRGMCERAPWQYEVTAVIPTINAAERLAVIVELLRLQTVRPFILLVDCGSTPDQFAKIEAMRAQDLEVQTLRLNGVQHTSEVVSMAMDLAQGRCATRFMFCTHDDCFLRSRSTLRYFRDLADVHHAAGHEITPRPHNDWPGMVGHTALMLDNDWLIDRGMTWNMRRGMRLFGIPDATPVVERGNWPDTECALNYLLRMARVKPFLTGHERNWTRNIDEWIDHCRTATSATLHERGAYMRKSQGWLKDAMVQGRKRIALWLDDPLPEVPSLPIRKPKAKLPVPGFTPGFFGE